MSHKTFETVPYLINQILIIRIPGDISSSFPSRGLCFAEGEISGIPFQTALEPDGAGSHWFTPEPELCQKAGIKAGRPLSIGIWPSDLRPEPQVPVDIEAALAGSSLIKDEWESLTPLARWDWIRWIRSTKNPATRQKRVEVCLDKLRKGDRRPCCFNRNICTLTDLSHKGVLKDHE